MDTDKTQNPFMVFSCGAVIGILGGLIGLGGAEFRLPLLIGLFAFPALEAVILNKTMSLCVVAVALPFRAATIPFATVFGRWDVIVTLLAGSMIGAWLGASWATRLKTTTLYRVIAVMLLSIAVILMVGHAGANGKQSGLLQGVALACVGALAGVGIGIVASVLGVAGGELLIPTITILFGVDLKLAGSLSLAVSMPTMLVGFSRYSREQSFSVIGKQKNFILIMVCGSVVGAFIGGQLLGVVPTEVLLPMLSLILLISAFKVWGHSAHAVSRA